MLNKAYIDLSKLRRNAEKIKGMLPETTLFNAVVKADAYGHGAEMVANAIYNIVDCYSVAIVEEGIKLRLSGIDKDILILSPLMKDDYEKVCEYNLTVTVDDIFTLKELEKVGEKQGKIINIHLKYNVGMNRFGVNNLNELKELIDEIRRSEHLKLCGMYSHLGDPGNKNTLIENENKFLLANNLVKGYNRKAICHISASGGFIQGLYYDMVRIGILLYGYKPFKTDKISVEPVMKITAPIVKRRTINVGESCLYGDNKINSSQDILLVRYGYADGLNREKTGEMINNRCMDVSAYYGYDKIENEKIVLDNAEKLGEEYGTISYEILTKSAMRAEKIYLY